MTPATMEALQAAVLPWAKENHREKYDMTLKVSTHPKSFRAYLLRLLEIRWQEDPESRCQMPLLALDETSIIVKARVDGELVEFHGKAAGVSPRRPIAELMMPKEEWRALENAKIAFDLEYDE